MHWVDFGSRRHPKGPCCSLQRRAARLSRAVGASPLVGVGEEERRLEQNPHRLVFPLAVTELPHEFDGGVNLILLH